MKNSIKKESNSVQPFSCSSETVEIRARQNVPNATYGMKGNSDWVEDTPIPYAYLGQTDFVGLHPGLQELYDMFQYPSIKSIFPEWSILVYEQYIKDFIPGLLWRYSGVSCISPDFRLKDHLPDIWDCSPLTIMLNTGHLIIHLIIGIPRLNTINFVGFIAIVSSQLIRHSALVSQVAIMQPRLTGHV